MRWLLSLLLLLPACAPQVVPAPVTRVFNCEGGYQFTLRNDGQRAALYRSAATQPEALRRNEGDGPVEVYRGEQNLKLRVRGEQAWVTGADGSAERNCASDRRAALWEDAAFRGVEFRAVNRGDGWYLELDAEKLFFTGAYGKEVETFAYAPPQVNDARAQTIYTGLSASGQSFELKLEAGLCVDRASRERFDTRVTLRIADQTRYGCGRYLVKRPGTLLP